jgi:ParB-like nuclease domain
MAKKKVATDVAFSKEIVDQLKDLTQMISVVHLRVNDKNPRTIKDKKFQNLVKQIKEFPQMLIIRPVVYDSTGMIIGGNRRFEAAVAAGLKEIPAIDAAFLTGEQIRLFVILDNASAGDWDFQMLIAEYNVEELEGMNLDIPVMLGTEEEEQPSNKAIRMTIDFQTVSDMEELKIELESRGFNVKTK